MNGPDRSGGVVELRVHGVSGASPAQVLGLQQTRQVAGDRSGGFYRPRPPCSDTDTPGVTLEAYRWGDLPSGTVARTLAVVFMLPFMLVNVAIWMRPASPGSEATVKSLCRVLGLTLTVLYVLTVAGVALDLVGWKCLASPDCLAGRSWLSWLGGRTIGLRLAVLALVPAAAIGAIWRVSSRPGRAFKAFRAPDHSSSASRLDAVGQWDAEPLVGRLRAIHVAAAFATLALVLLLAQGTSHASGVSVALTAITAVILTVCVGLLCTPQLLDRYPADQRLDGITRILRNAAIVLTVVVVAHLPTRTQPWPQQHGLPGYDPALVGVFAAQTTLLAALGVALLWHRRRERGTTPLFGLGALVVAATGISMAVAYSAELVCRVADYLDRGVATTEGITAGPPRAFTWAIYGFFRAVLITTIVAGLVILISRRSRRRAAAAILARDFPNPPAEAEPRLRQVRDAIARARFTEKLVPLAVVYSCLAGLGTATTTVGLLGQQPGDVIERNIGLPAEATTFIIALSSWVIAAVLLGLIIGAIFAYRTEPYRRYIGVLWDLGTFWPRAAHPFAPPCYSRRAVPELTRRITYLVERGHAVVLTGHSHGSILLAAAVLQLPPQICGRVALLTHGSPLRRFCTRPFPAYLDDVALREIGRKVGWRWVNLWRDTDPIGGWIFSKSRSPASVSTGDPATGVDRRQRDPHGLVAPPGESVAPPIHGHWPDESNEPFTSVVRELAQRLERRGDPPGPPR
ncbi:hypothetical protein [Micromonospora sp. DH14]|uniref:hypothetical protein n=1 Tax=Micromonospora sp. DH14 TaxID=3040120 RepID=UPI002441A138|nr:hypothetical protein [Micromonospora sp. DH14]MDG9676592.1 hypothetical protein [Micromonospora sp. DH14]